MYLIAYSVDKLLTEPNEDEEEAHPLPSLTLNDLIGLISDLTEVNSKRNSIYLSLEPLKRPCYPLSDMNDQYMKNNNIEGDAHNHPNSNTWAQYNKYREAFDE